MKISSTLLFFLLITGSFSTQAQLNEGFEGTAFPPLGWSSFIGTNGAGSLQDWQRTTSAADVSTGVGAAFVRYEVTGGPLAEDWLVTPKLRPDAIDFTLYFYQKQAYTFDYGTTYSIQVSTTDQNDPASYTVVASQTEANFTTTYSLASVDLSAYIGQDIYVAFVMSQDDGDNWYIDDVTGPPLAPQCFPPSNVTLSNITLTTADIAWDQNNATTDWEIETVEAYTPPTGAGQFVNFNPATYPSLDSATTYYVFIRDVCGPSDTSIWVGPVPFSTLCPTVFNAPFIEDFDLPFTQNCWTESGAAPWDYSTVAAYDAGNANDHTGNSTNYAWMDGSYNNNGAVSVLTSPLIDISSLTIPRLNFWVFSQNTYNSTYNDLVVEVWNGSVWTQIYQNQGDLGGWSEITYYLNALSPTGPIQVRYTITGTSDPSPWYNDILIDDFVIDESPDCPTPSLLTATNVGNTSADLGWTANGSGSTWEVEIVEAANPVTGSGVFTGSNPYPATGLNMGTPYSFYVREICSPGDTSAWVGPFNFMTSCGTYIAPYLETFDENYIAPCWSQSGAFPWTFSTSADYSATSAGDYTGNGGNYAWIDGSSNLNGAISTLTSPLVDISPLSTPALRYYVYSENIHNNTNNEVLVEFYDGAIWNTIQTFQGNLGREWFEVIVNLNNFTITGPVQVRFSVTGSSDPSPWYNDILIDNVEFYDGPSCYTPTNLIASNITMTSADLGWTPGDISNTLWELELIELGQSFSGSGNFTTSNPLNNSSLQFGTTYLFAVREICSPGDTSNWSVPYLFTTPCPSPLAGDSMSSAIIVNTTTFSDSGNTTNCYTHTTGFNSPDVWYQLILEECTGNLLVELCNSDFDTYLRLLDVDSVQLRSDDDRCGTTGGPSLLNADVTGLDTVYIVVEGYAVATGSFHIYIEQQVADLLGDQMNNPIPVTSIPYLDSSTTDSCFTNTFNGNPSKDVWYCYVSDTSTYFNFSLCGSSFDTYMYITDSSGTTISSSDNDCSSQSQIGGLYINSGDTVYIVVEGTGSNSGAYVLNISFDSSDIIVSDVRGQMYNFDGTDDFISIADNPTLNPTRISLEAWVYSDDWSSQTNPVIITKGINAEYSLWKSDDVGFDEKFAFRIGNNIANTTYSTTTVQDGKWYHVVATYGGTRSKLYVNGVEESSLLFSMAIPDLGNPLTIGAATGGAAAFDGSIDEVRIWNRIRTQTEIREKMHLTLKDTETNLISYFQFDFDWTVGNVDGVQNGTRTNHGTTQNMTSSNLVASTAHIGGGTSNTQTVLATGNVVFTGTDLEINFGTSPNGDIVVSHITTENSYAPPPYGPIDTGYWVVNNYGTITTGLNVTALFNYDDGLIPNTTLTNYSLYKRPSREFGTWPTVIPFASAASTVPGNNYCEFSGLDGFSQLVPVNMSDFLPNEFLYFTAQPTANKEVLLTWEIDNEIDNKEFEIERSPDGFSWEYLGTVASTNALGHIYNYYDTNPLTGHNYYRLKRIENSGIFSYSTIQVVDFITEQNFWVYPNPNNGIFFVEFDQMELGELEVFDAIGQKVLVKTLNSNKEAFDISDQPSGIYTIKITSHGKSFYTRVVRE